MDLFTPIAVQLIILIGVLVLWLLTISAMGVFIYLWKRETKGDKVIFFDKMDRWRLISVFLKGKTKFAHNGEEYHIIEGKTRLNSKGKALLCYSEGKSTQMEFGYNKAEWLSAKTLKAIIDNEVLQKLIRPQEKLKDMILILGAIGGFVAGITSTLVALKMYGVIK